MPVNRKAFGQIIYNHIHHVAIHQFNKPSNLFSHQMMMNLDMLRASMKN